MHTVLVDDKKCTNWNAAKGEWISIRSNPLFKAISLKMLIFDTTGVTTANKNQMSFEFIHGIVISFFW